MRFWGILWFLGLGGALFASSESCDCGTVQADPFYAKAVHLLYESVPPLFKYASAGEGLPYSFPYNAQWYYPSCDAYSDGLHYLQRGCIFWDANARSVCQHFLGIKSDEELRKFERNHSSQLGCCKHVEVPIRMTRSFTPFDGYKIDENRVRERVFKFKKDYGAISQAFRVLEDDITTYYEQDIQFLTDRLRDIANGADVWSDTHRDNPYPECVDVYKELKESRQDARKHYRRTLNDLEKNKAESFTACKASLDRCIANHHSSTAHLSRGLFAYLEGDPIDALDHIRMAMDPSLPDGCSHLEDEALLIKGQSELEAGLYADAILSLSSLINRNPQNKEVYFERASAYFELGNFDESLNDYLQSGVRPHFANAQVEPGAYNECMALTEGIVRGIGGGASEYLPNLAGTAAFVGKGLGNALWAYGKDPMQASVDFARAVYQYGEFIATQPLSATVEAMFPEVKELAENWGTLNRVERIRRTGAIVGKYGVEICLDIVLTKGTATLLKTTRNLVKANNLMNFEALRVNTAAMKAHAVEANGKVVAEWENALKRQMPPTQANSTRGWQVGQNINNLTAEGKIPKWITVRQRYWKNRAEWAKSNPNHNYGEVNIPRMEKGLAPQRLNEGTGMRESKELHHNPAQREGGLFDFIEVWADEHAAIDAQRHI